MPSDTTEDSHLWQFINALPDVLLWRTSADDTLTFVSDGLATLLGTNKDALLAEPAAWQNRVFPGHRARYKRSVQIARDNATYTDLEYRARLPGIGTTWLRDHVMVDAATGDLFGITTKIGDQHETTERLGFLNKAARLFAGSLSTRQLLDQLGELMAGSLANVCIIETIEEGGTHVVVRTDAGRRLRGALEHEGPMILDGRRLPAKLKQGQAILYEALPARRLNSLIGAARVKDFGRRPPHAAILAPLMVRRQLLGTVTLLCNDEDRDYTGKDVELARDVCSQAAIALDHARLFEETALAQARLSTENEMKDEFLALMSHELKTPLTVIYGVSRILPRVLPPLDETSSQFVDDLYTAAERTVRLVDDLMLLARLNLGESPELEAVAVPPLLAEVAEDFRNQYQGRTLQVLCREDEPLVTGSPPYIRQVLFNLLSNAHKYSPLEGELALGAARKGDDVVFTVVDSGKGVTEEELEHLFERFYRASNSDGISGSGMGLAICRRLIEALGGEIWAENSDGAGLRVSFSLPTWQDR